MDLSSINNTLLSLQNLPADQSSMGAVAAEDGQKADPEKVDAGGQDLPTAEAAQAASATSGASSATLSAEMQALLLQTQESNAALSLLQTGNAGGSGLLSAWGEDDSDPEDWFTTSANAIGADTSKFLKQVQATNSSTISNASAPDTSQSVAQMQAILADFLNSVSATDSIDASNQTLMSLMGGVGGAGLAEDG